MRTRKPLGALHVRTPFELAEGCSSTHVPLAPVRRPLASVAGVPEMRIFALVAARTLKLTGAPRASVARGPTYSNEPWACAAAGARTAASAAAAARTRGIARGIGPTGAGLESDRERSDRGPRG